MFSGADWKLSQIGMVLFGTLRFKNNKKIDVWNWNQINNYLGHVAESLNVKSSLMYVRTTGKFSLEGAYSKSDHVAQGLSSSVLHF